MRKLIKISSLLCAALFATSVTAKECSEILWSPEITQKYPNIGAMCQEVLDVNGETVVKMKADVIRMSGMNDVVLDMHLEDGSKDRVTVEDVENIKINGEYTFDQLPRGYEITMHVPEGDRFAIIEIMSDISADKIAAASTLPKTATQQGWLVIFAGVFLILGFALRRVNR
ncbi:hypothetical protein ACFSJY_06505 [Thalassotalea euphylliae]|uniref:hypothetical protein n=1 Tax=Thalassotalea euphylliae TaxID=1655234 RepID=UPI0036345D8A